MKALSDFLPFVLPSVPGCSDPMAEQAVLTACIEFASKSLIVQHTGSDNLVAGQTEYDVEQPSMQILVKVLAVFHLDTRLTARSREMVRSGYAARGDAVTGYTPPEGTPREWFCRNPSEAVVSLYPTPAEAAADALTIVAAYAPTWTATRVADILFTDYASDIAAGAIAHLLIVPAQPFTNPGLHKVHQDKFNAAMHSAANLARVGLGAASSRVQPVAFAGR